MEITEICADENGETHFRAKTAELELRDFAPGLRELTPLDAQRQLVPPFPADNRCDRSAVAASSCGSRPAA
jgi:hypothetical protein